MSGGTYTRVCGRAVGYTVQTVDAFTDLSGGGRDINLAYLDGLSVTYSSPRQHIWSLAGGHGPEYGGYRCPCDNLDRGYAPLPPSFVGDNYYCDGSYNGALWDGEDCTTTCCTFNSPPFFHVTLPHPTSDDIEVRICIDEDAEEGMQIRLLQLFVQ